MKPKTARPAVVTVLIADDDPIVRQAVKSVLDVSGGFKVVGEAEDGKMAAELVKKTDPDILLLDLLMPNLPGLEALRAITTVGSEVRTVLLCSAISAKQVLEALQLGARGVVLKKKVAELIPALEAVIRGQYWIQSQSVSNVVEVVQQLAATNPQSSESQNRFGLTTRETEIISFITQGCMNRDIASSLSITEETVKRHLTNIFNKVGMSNRLELALFAIEHGLVRK
ncbi:MAG TPA: response regulator transcription factor [Terriglobales bacterium]|nr:response regulator transcription factor [Terriglobales bacterium]